MLNFRNECSIADHMFSRLSEFDWIVGATFDGPFEVWANLGRAPREETLFTLNPADPKYYLEGKFLYYKMFQDILHGIVEKGGIYTGEQEKFNVLFPTEEQLNSVEFPLELAIQFECDALRDRILGGMHDYVSLEVYPSPYPNHTNGEIIFDCTVHFMNKTYERQFNIAGKAPKDMYEEAQKTFRSFVKKRFKKLVEKYTVVLSECITTYDCYKR